MNTAIPTFLAALACSAIAPTSLLAALDFQPTDDTWLGSGQPDDVNGAASELRAMGWLDIGAARPLLKFDLSSIPDGSVLSSAQLTLFQNGFGTGSWTTFPVDVWRMSSDAWTEGTATWNNYDHTGNMVCRLQPPHDNGPRVFDINLTDWAYATDLQDDVVTFQLRWGDELSQHYKDVFYQSKEATISPVLTINAIPEPGSAFAIAGALGLMAARRRRVTGR